MQPGRARTLFAVCYIGGTSAQSNAVLADMLSGLRDVNEMANRIARTPSGGMVSLARRKLSVRLAARALLDDVPGDFVETGTNSGGTAVLLLKTLLELDEAAPKREEDPVVVSHRAASGHIGRAGSFRTSRQAFDENMKRNGVDLPDRLRVGQGWFNETLPKYKGEIGPISFLRLDGDIFVSTWDALVNLYPQVSPGGYIYVDDYGSYSGCRLAINRYRAEHNISEVMTPECECRVPSDNNVMVCAPVAVCKHILRKGTGDVPLKLGNVNNIEFEAVWWRKRK